MMLKVRPSPDPDLPQLPRSPFLHAVLTTPVDRTGACRFLSLPARPSPVNWRVGVHFHTSEACSKLHSRYGLQDCSPPKADSCSEAPTRSVSRPSRSVATMLTDNYMGGSSSHWRSAPLGRTVDPSCCRAHADDRFQSRPVISESQTD